MWCMYVVVCRRTAVILCIKRSRLPWIPYIICANLAYNGNASQEMLYRHMPETTMCCKHKAYGWFPKTTHVSKSHSFYTTQQVVSFCLFHTVKATRDVHITESTIATVAGPGAQVGTTSVVSQLHPPSKDEGMWKIKHPRNEFPITCKLRYCKLSWFKLL